MNFFIKYKPRKLNDIKGNTFSLKLLKDCVVNFRKGKGVLLYGWNGVGKSVSVYALANELGYEVIELNASDYRDKDSIKNIIGESSKQRSLFKKGKIILIDDIDNFNVKDRGGIHAISEVIEESEFPIVMTGIDIWDSKLKSIRNKSKLIEFKKLANNEIYTFLKEICEKECIKFDEGLLKKISRRANGDLRASLNDLQNSIINGELKEGDFGDREYKQSIFDALRLVLKGRDAKMLLDIFSKTGLELEECFLWLDENLPREYSKEDLRKGYEVMSRADVFNGRIRKQQYYRFLIYISGLLTAGIGLSKREKNPGFIMYKSPSRILKLWISKQKLAKKKAIAEKIAEKTHLSVRRVLREFAYYKNFLIDKDVVKELKLDDSEVEWLRK